MTDPEPEPRKRIDPEVFDALWALYRMVDLLAWHVDELRPESRDEIANAVADVADTLGRIKNSEDWSITHDEPAPLPPVDPRVADALWALYGLGDILAFYMDKPGLEYHNEIDAARAEAAGALGRIKNSEDREHHP